MGPGSLLAGSQAEAQTYLSPAGRQRPQPRLQALRKACTSLVCRSRFPNRTGQPGPEEAPRARGRQVPRELACTSQGLRARKGPESEMQACAVGSPWGRWPTCAGGRQPVCQANSLWAARTQDSGPRRSPGPGLSPPGHKHSELGAAVSSVPSDLAALLVLCYLNPTTSFSEPQHPTVQERGPWSQAHELVLSQSWNPDRRLPEVGQSGHGMEMPTS